MSLKMGSIDGVIEPIYFLITSIGFVILSFIHYKKTGKTLETIYLSILAVFFIMNKAQYYKSNRGNKEIYWFNLTFN